MPLAQATVSSPVRKCVRKESTEDWQIREVIMSCSAKVFHFATVFLPKLKIARLLAVQLLQLVPIFP